MTQIQNVGAAIYSTLAVATQAEATPANFINVPNLRGTPTVGNEANIVQVPQFGTAAALNIAAQATLPDFEFELNFVPGSLVHQAILLSAGIAGGENVRSSGDGDHPDQLVLDATGAEVATGAAAAAETAFGPGFVYSWRLTFRNAATGENSTFEFDGQVAGFSAAPNTEDASVATVTLSLQAIPTGPSTVA